MPTKTAHRDYNKLLPRSDTLQTQISNIDDAIVYNTTCRWGEGHTRGGLTNHNTLGHLSNQSSSCISEGGAS